jgi:AcrR family transcriptional regulator
MQPEAAQPEVARVEPHDSRQRILDATAHAIATRGVRGLRIEDVASEAGVSAALLYYHFKSRSGLVKAALEHASDHAPSASIPRGNGNGKVVASNNGNALAHTGREAVRTALLAEFGEEPDVRDNAVVWGEVSMSAVFEPELRDDVRRVTELWRDSVAAGIRGGIADGSIQADVDPEITAELLISTVDGLCNRWLAGAIDRCKARQLLDVALEHYLTR